MKNSTAIIIVIISIALFYTYIEPEYTKVKALKANLTEYENIIQNISDLKTQRDNLLISYNAIRDKNQGADITRLAKALPDYVDTVRLAMDFDNISAKYGISIKSIQVVDDKKNNSASIAEAVSYKSYNTTTVSFSFITTYDSFRKFMKDIEQSLRIIDVKEVSFQASENGLNEYKVSIQTYWLK